METPALEIEVRPTDEHDIEVVLSGELDLSTAPSLRACVEGLGNGYRQVLIDLGDLHFLDSTGVALLLSFQRSFGPEFRQLTVRCPPGPVRRVLQVSGVESRLAIVG